MDKIGCDDPQVTPGGGGLAEGTGMTFVGTCALSLSSTPGDEVGLNVFSFASTSQATGWVTSGKFKSSMANPQGSGAVYVVYSTTEPWVVMVQAENQGAAQRIAAAMGNATIHYEPGPWT
jgi:hypothetical protein